MLSTCMSKKQSHTQYIRKKHSIGYVVNSRYEYELNNDVILNFDTWWKYHQFYMLQCTQGPPKGPVKKICALFCPDTLLFLNFQYITLPQPASRQDMNFSGVLSGIMCTDNILLPVFFPQCIASNVIFCTGDHYVDCDETACYLQTSSSLSWVQISHPVD